MSQSVLVIDDDKLLLTSLSESLREAGLEVIEAVDGKAGLAVALERHPSIIVTDLRMPELDGLGMIQQLRKDEWGAKVPVIILTTDDDTESVNEAMKVGVSTYLAKSNLSPDTVVEQVKTTLGA